MMINSSPTHSDHGELTSALNTSVKSHVKKKEAADKTHIAEYAHKQWTVPSIVFVCLQNRYQLTLSTVSDTNNSNIPPMAPVKCSVLWRSSGAHAMIISIMHPVVAAHTLMITDVFIPQKVTIRRVLIQVVAIIMTQLRVNPPANKPRSGDVEPPKLEME